LTSRVSSEYPDQRVNIINLWSTFSRDGVDEIYGPMSEFMEIPRLSDSSPSEVNDIESAEAQDILSAKYVYYDDRAATRD
jgi:hypothetical protein